MVILMLFIHLLQTDSSALKQLKLRLNELHYTGQVADYMKLKAECERYLNLDKQNFYLQFYLGIIHDQIGSQTMGTDADKADTFFDKAVSHFETALQIKKDAVVYAYLSSVYGKKINISGFRAISLGPKSASMIEQALAIDNSNPQVLIFHAINKMYTPGFFGGDKELARKQLEKAVANFQSYQYSDILLPNWTLADAYLWLAQLDKVEEKKEEFLTHITKALEIRPDFGFAHFVKNSWK